MANTVEIVLSANDQASKKIDVIGAGLIAVGKAASVATIPIQALSRAVVELGTRSAAQLTSGLLNPLGTISTVLGPLTGIFNSVSGAARVFNEIINQINNNPIIRPATLSILREAERAIDDLEANLTDTFKGTGEVITPILQGIVPRFDEFSNRASASVARIGSAFSGLGTQIGPALAAGLNKADVVIQKIIDKAEKVPQRIANNLQGVGNIFGAIAGFDEPLAVFDAIRQGTGAITSGIFAATQEIAFFSAGLQALQQFVVQGPFQLLIGQNITLREQLLATQSSLVATSKVLQNGVAIADPTIAIQALQTPIEGAIKSLREGSLELVGVTSDQLVPLFQQVAGQASNIGASLTDATDLSLSFAAALGTLNIPLFQSQQEIGSILQGTIDQNSILAKSLAITNQQVATWRSQGTLVEQLSKRLEAFRAGNALAAQTINGVSSNIQELFQEIARVAGEPLLKPIITELNNFYKFLNENRDALGDGVSAAVTQIQKAGEGIVQITKSTFTAVQGTLAQIPTYLLKSFANLITGIASALDTFLPAIQPVLDVFAELAKSAFALGGPFLQLFLQFTVISKGISLLSSSFGVLSQTVEPFGSLLFLLTGRNNSLIKSFIGLRGQVGLGAAGFLLLGKNLANIPPLMNLLAKQVPIFGPAIAALTPQISALATQGIGLVKAYPAVGKIFENLTQKLPLLATAASPFAEQILPGLGGQLRNAAGQAANFGAALGKTNIEDRIVAIENLTGATNRFSGLMRTLGGFLGQAVLKFTLLSGGIYIAIQAFDQFILKNEGALAILKGIADLAQTVGKAVLQFLSNPFVIATSAVFGLAYAIKSGLIASLIDLAKTFALTSGKELLATFAAISRSVGELSNVIRTNKIENLPDFFGRRGELSRAAAEAKKELEASTQALSDAVEKRRVAVQSIQGQIDDVLSSDLSRQDKTKQVSRLQKQKSALEAETQGNITLLADQKKAVEAKLAPLEQELANTLSFSERVGGKQKRDLKAQIKGLTDEIKAGTEEYVQALSQRQNKIRKINEQLSIAQAIGGLAPNGATQAELKAQKEQIIAETREIVSQRQAQQQKLGQLQADLNNIPSVGSRLSKSFSGIRESVTSFVSSIDFSRQGLANLGAGMAKAGTAVVGFGRSLAVAAAEVAVTLGPVVLLIAAITTITEVIGSYIRIQEAGAAATKAFSEATKEADDKVRKLAEQRKALLGQKIEPNVDLQGLRLKEIQDGQNIVTKFFELLRAQIRAIQAPFGAVIGAITGGAKLITNTIGGVIKIVGNLIAPVQLIGTISDQVGKQLGDAFKPVLQTLQPIIDVINFIQGSLSGLGISEAQSQLNSETQGFNKLLDAGNKKYQELKGQVQDSIKLEQEKANLQKQRAEAQAQGNSNEVQQIDDRITKIDEELNARKEVVDAAIKGAESQKPLTQQQARDQANLVLLLKGYRKELDGLANTSITPPDLPRLGTAYEQLSLQARQAEDAISKGTGNPEEFKKKAQVLLDATNQQVQAGLITQEEARRRLSLLSTNVNADAEFQIKAQEGITASFQKSADDRVSAYETQISEIERLSATGVISQSDGEAQITEVKKKQIADRLSLTRQALQEEIDIAQKRAQLTIAFLDQELKKEGLSNEDRKKLLEQRAAAELAAREAGAGNSDKARQLRLQATQLETEQAKLEQESRVKEIQRATDKALRITKEAETQRQILIQQLVNSRQASEAEAQDLLAQSNKQRISEELKAEKDKLNQLLQNENANADAIKESRGRILSLTLESLKAEGDAYDAYINRVKSALDKQVTDREIAIQQSVNAGVTTEAQAANERARINVARLRAELAAETKNTTRRRELTLQLAQAERQLQESNLAVLSEALDRQNLAYENAINKQNTELQKQVDLYNNLNEALGTRTRLFEAQKDVQSAAEGFLVSQINGVAALERSERKKQQLAKATAILQYDALLQRQALEDKILETQQQQNLLALQRQQIENQIAQARNDVDIAKAEGAIARSQDELRTGKISQQEFDARVRERDALARVGISLRQQGAIIDSQIAIQPALDAAARQQAELAQASQRSDGLVNIFNNLGRGEQRQVRGQLQDFLSQQAGFSNRGELINQGRELGQSFVENVRRGMPDAGLGSFEQFTPRTSAISNMLDRAQGEVPTRQVLEAQRGFSDSLNSQIETIRSEAQRVRLENARPLPTLQLPGQLPNIEAIRQQQMQSQQPRQLSPEQIQSIANAFWERFSGFGDGVTRDRPNGPNGQPVKVDSINTTINLQDTGEVAKKLAETTQRQLLDTVKRANQLADQRR